MDIPFDLLKLVSSFLVEPRMKLLDWINIDKISPSYLASNPCNGAIRLLEQIEPDLDDIHWYNLSTNPCEYAIRLLEKHPKQRNSALVYNPNALHILELFPQKSYNWLGLSSNPNAIQMLAANPDKINWDEFSKNPNLLNAIHLLEKYPDKINWFNLSENPNALHFLEKHPNKIKWYSLSKNPNALHLLEANLDKIDWTMLSTNPNALHLLEANLDKINWKMLSDNTNPRAIQLLETVVLNAISLKKPIDDIIDLYYLSINPSAIKLLEIIAQNNDNPLGSVDWIRLSTNPSIFEIDILQYETDINNKAKNIDC